MPETSTYRHRPRKADLKVLPPAPAPGRPATSRRRDETHAAYAKRTLRETGFRLGDEARAARPDVEKAGRAAAKALDAGDDLFGDAGNLVLVVIGGILGLIVLELIVSPRGASVFGDASSWLTGGLSRLVSPTDPIVGTGQSINTNAAALQALTATDNPVTNPNAYGPPLPARSAVLSPAVSAIAAHSLPTVKGG